MYEDYEPEYYEPTEEEMEEFMGYSDTTTKPEENNLKIEFDFSNFSQGIIRSVVESLKTDLKKEILGEISESVLKDLKETIKNNVNTIIKGFIDEFLETEKITVYNNGSAWDSTSEEITIKQYVKRCLKECIENQSFRIQQSCGNRSSYTSYKFSEYLQENIGVNHEIQKYLDSSIESIRKQVNHDIKEAFNNSTKSLLSDAVLQVLMANDTYKKIESNLSCIATAKTE